MKFELLVSAECFSDPIAGDADLLRRANRPLARIWVAQPSLVMPRSYQRHPGVNRVCAHFAARGLPIYVRASGGGLVPQGPGILNLSLAYPVAGSPGQAVEAIYLHLCALLRDTLQPLGIVTDCLAVPGSFCDGRFNLACEDGSHVQKIAGTAQHWRVAPAGRSGYTVLAHALLLVAPDLSEIDHNLNEFERALQTGTSYDAARTTSVAQRIGAASPGDLMQEICERLRAIVVKAEPPQLSVAANQAAHSARC